MIHGMTLRGSLPWFHSTPYIHAIRSNTRSPPFSINFNISKWTTKCQTSPSTTPKNLRHVPFIRLTYFKHLYGYCTDKKFHQTMPGNRRNSVYPRHVHGEAHLQMTFLRLVRPTSDTPPPEFQLARAKVVTFFPLHNYFHLLSLSCAWSADCRKLKKKTTFVSPSWAHLSLPPPISTQNPTTNTVTRLYPLKLSVKDFSYSWKYPRAVTASTQGILSISTFPTASATPFRGLLLPLTLSSDEARKRVGRGIVFSGILICHFY